KEVRPPQGYQMPTFKGLPGEDVGAWIFQMDTYFTYCNIQRDDRKIQTAVMMLEGEPRTFMTIAAKEQGAMKWRWEDLCRKFTRKYKELLNSTSSLRQRLDNVPFNGIEKMDEFCLEFSKVACQIYDMDRNDKRHVFVKSIPSSCVIAI